ncbi:MAG: hypothetical protein ACRC8K_19585, partial [Waterburya sp.]
NAQSVVLTSDNSETEVSCAIKVREPSTGIELPSKDAAEATEDMNNKIGKLNKKLFSIRFKYDAKGQASNA